MFQYNIYVHTVCTSISVVLSVHRSVRTNKNVFLYIFTSIGRGVPVFLFRRVFLVGLPVYLSECTGCSVDLPVCLSVHVNEYLFMSAYLLFALSLLRPTSMFSVCALYVYMFVFFMYLYL